MTNKENRRLVKTLIDKGHIISHAEGRRLIAQKAIKINDRVCLDDEILIHDPNGIKVQIGKRKIVQI